MRITEVTPEVFAVDGGAVTWTILREGEALTLVDAGYPGDADAVVDSIREVGGRPEDLEAVLVTHGHIDHIGGIPALLDRHDVPVLASPAEAPLVRRDRKEQAGPIDILTHLTTPGMLGWMREIIGKGALRDRGVAQVRPFDEPLSVPGGPIPVPCAGHTSGHTAYLVPRAGALLTGDALVTGHPLSRDDGPQLLPKFFHTDAAAAAAVLDDLAGVEADVIVPGHGPVVSMRAAEAVDRVRRNGD